MFVVPPVFSLCFFVFLSLNLVTKLFSRSFSSFELSVPGLALVATPNHGTVAPLSSFSVSLTANKTALSKDGAAPLLPWTGSLYVNGDDGATVAVKVGPTKD